MAKYLLSAILFIFFSFPKTQGQSAFYKIPAATIQPYVLLGDTNQLKLSVGRLQISQQITFGQYKEYLKKIYANSSREFYFSQLPDSSISTKEIYNTYTTGNTYDNYPVMGISWEAAMNYCKWKTLQENKDSCIPIAYRLPTCFEWLSAYTFLNNSDAFHDLNNLFSDWLINIMYDGGFGLKTLAYDQVYMHELDDRPATKRKLVIGNSYLYHLKYLKGYLRYSYFADQGYRQVGFRIVRITNPRIFPVK